MKTKEKNLEAIHFAYDDYIEEMHSQGGFRTYEFEDWIKWQYRINKLTKKEFEKCYDEEGYLLEPKLKCDMD